MTAPSAPVRLPSLPDRRPEPKGEVRRAALLAAIEGLLRERPLADLSIGEISSAAGLTRSAFYFYFPSKEAAVTELLHDVFEETLAGAKAWLGGEGDPEVSLGAALARTAELWGVHRHLMLAMLDARRGDDAVRILWDSWVERFVAPLAETVEAERDAGRAPHGPPAENLVRLLLGMNVSALEHHLRQDGDEARTTALVEAMTVVWVSALYGSLSGR